MLLSVCFLAASELHLSFADFLLLLVFFDVVGCFALVLYFVLSCFFCFVGSARASSELRRSLFVVVCLLFVCCCWLFFRWCCAFWFSVGCFFGAMTEGIITANFRQTRSLSSSASTRILLASVDSTCFAMRLWNAQGSPRVKPGGGSSTRARCCCSWLAGVDLVPCLPASNIV